MEIYWEALRPSHIVDILDSHTPPYAQEVRALPLPREGGHDAGSGDEMPVELEELQA